MDANSDMNLSAVNYSDDFQSMKVTLDSFKSNVDVMYLFFSGNLVLFMQAGFAFLECGVVRSKNTTNILIKNLLDLFISGIAFWLTGYAFLMGEGDTFMGYTKFASKDVSDKEMSVWFFQYVFASTASTIVSGAVAERCNFVAYLMYSAVISGIVYPFLAHWAWHSEGWLKKGDGTYHYMDFAGGGVVHMCGGICSFVGAYFLGPRIGRFDPVTKKPVEIPGHSMPLVALGGFILIVGFVAFNGGSQGHISNEGDGGTVATIVANTMISGSFGAITALIVHKSGLFGTPKQWSFLYSLNGSLLSMVAVCPGGDRFYPWISAIVGIVGGILFFVIRKLLLLMRIDDPLDAVPVHFGGGFWGLIASPLLARDRSLAFPGPNDPHPARWLGWNMIGFLANVVWSAGITAILFGVLTYFKMFRVSPELEMKGMDIPKHGEPAYPVSGWQEEQYTCFSIQEICKNSLTPVMLTSLKPDIGEGIGGARINIGFVPEATTHL